MKNGVRLVLAAALLWLCQSSGTVAMTQSQIPAKFSIPFGNNAGAPYIRNVPQTSQIGVQNCAASLADGFPPLTFVPAAAGGCPPFGQDMNGILRQITQWNVWMQAVSGLPYDAAFSAAIGGYPKGAIVQSTLLPGRLWFSISDNNTTSPDATTGSSGWTVLPGTNAPGTPIPVLSASAPPPNAVAANGLTVGNASSNATGRANPDTFWLFAFLWSNCSSCQLFNSSGGVVSRGASAAADFAANDAVQALNMNGAALMGADGIGGTTSSFLVNIPVTSGSRTAPGSILGENLHQLSVAELAAHTHANAASDPGHTHGDFISDPGHAHGASVSDPGHNHNIAPTAILAGTQGQGGVGGGGQFGIGGAQGTTSNVTGIGVGIFSSATGIVLHNAAAATGITIVNASQGSNVPHNTVPRSVIVYWYLAL